MENKPKLIAVVGQTATGKSDLAVDIAISLAKKGQKYGGEIISADSRQVYKGLDIGTGKITKKEMCNVPHFLIDVANPKKQFNVADFKKLADKKIDEINKRGNVPIIVGGTGFFIQALLEDMEMPDVPPNPALRNKLNKQSAEELFNILRKLDHDRAKSIDRNNKVRLIRAIEIAKSLGKVPKLKKQNKYQVLEIGLKLPDEILKEKIKLRLMKRIKVGMIKEAESLHKKGLSWKRMKELGLEYKYLALYLKKKLSKEEMTEQLNSAIWQYAKRQWTWFKRNKNIIWVNPLNKNDISKLKEIIKHF